MIPVPVSPEVKLKTCQTEGKRIPFNSKRLPAAYLTMVGEALCLPTSCSREELRQLVEGKLASDKGVEVSSVQVVAHETPQLATKLWLVDSEGIVMETSAVREMSEPRAALAHPESEELHQLRRELASALEEAAHLRRDFEEEPEEGTASALAAQVAELQEALAAEGAVEMELQPGVRPGCSTGNEGR